MAESILEPIHLIRFGTSLEYGSDTPFFRDLSAYQRHLTSAKHNTISTPAIRSWLAATRRSVPKRLDAMKFLRGYVSWIMHRGQIAQDQEEAVATVQRLLSHYDEPDLVAPQSVNRAQGEEKLEPIIARTLQSIIATSNNNPRPVANDLFHNADSRAERDHSYFLLYRYSTRNGAILKSFLVCQKPERNVTTSYGFNHFVWGGTQPEFRQHIYRECEGLLLSFARSYYFVGFHYVVPADKRQDPDIYQEERRKSKRRPNGLGMIAAEYEDIHLRPGLFGGVTMTLAASGQPVLGRVAFLHLGTRSRMEIEVRDTDVEPAELRSRDLASDLKRVVDRLRRKGCKQLGLELQLRSARADWPRTGSAQLAKEIRGMVQNVPAWDDEERNAEERGLGAIEVFGHSRD